MSIINSESKLPKGLLNRLNFLTIVTLVLRHCTCIFWPANFNKVGQELLILHSNQRPETGVGLNI